MHTTGTISQPKSPTQFYSQIAFINPGLYYNPLFQKNKHNRNIINIFIKRD